jgi:hypothetical protein
VFYGNTQFLLSSGASRLRYDFGLYFFFFENCDDEKIPTATMGDDEGDVISSHPFISNDGY